TRHRAQGAPAEDAAVLPGDQPALRQMASVPLLPGRGLGLEGRLAGGDAFQVDGADRLPVGRMEFVDKEAHVHGRHTCSQPTYGPRSPYANEPHTDVRPNSAAQCQISASRLRPRLGSVTTRAQAAWPGEGTSSGSSSRIDQWGTTTLRAPSS